MRIKFILSFLIFLLPVIANAQSIDILWQGETYTPPFYQGRTLWSTESRITLVAIPHNLGNRNALNYRWTQNSTVLGNVSGVGKHSLSFMDPIISRPQKIKVEIMSGSGSVLSSAETTITPTKQGVLVYENNPLYGFLFNKEVGSEYSIEGDEVTFTSFPLFFSARGFSDNTHSYKWQANLGEIETGNQVTYRTPENTSGSSRITTQISNGDFITQNAQKTFLVKFGE